MATILFTNSEEYLNKIANDFVEFAKEEIRANGSVVSGRLLNSLRTTEGKPEGNIYSVLIDYEFYGEFVDDGAERKAGKMPPVKPLMEWIRMKSIKVPQGKTVESFAYAIAKNIAKRGQKDKRPKPWIDISLQRAFKENEEQYSVAILKDINQVQVDMYEKMGYKVTTTIK